MEILEEVAIEEFLAVLLPAEQLDDRAFRVIFYVDKLFSLWFILEHLDEPWRRATCEYVQ